jgi:phosphatidylserine/phosphatidylglycerophosphate/cardiolipin synthase-like enzyme
MSAKRRLAVVGAATVAAIGATAMRRTPRRTSDPGSPDAIHAEDAQDRAVTLVAKGGVRRSDLAMTFAPAISTSVDPLLHGRRYFPRMLEDVKAASGVEVRLAVDAIGSETDFGSKELFRSLLDAGVQVVAHDGLFVARTGTVGAHKPAAKAEDFLHFDHRKMAVFDGSVAYVGGSGIEDHYNDERFYDVMCRVTGPIVAQLQTVFLASWRHHDGPRPDDPALARYYPAATLKVAARSKLKSPTTILWNVPGTGHHPISDAIERALENARERIDIVNPYISNRAILERLLAAAERGVVVRLVAPGKPTPPYPAAAFRHWYPRLLEAGATILLHPEMAHAKVLRIDDRVLIGGCNLDDLSLFRNDELDLQFEDPAVAELTEHAIFDELVSMSVPAEVVSDRRTQLWNAAMDRASRWL